MADILIRDMEMPEGCRSCPLYAYDGDMDYYCLISSYNEPCPLIPIPEGHGRLVDTREVLEKAGKASWFDGDVSELGLLLGSEVTTIVPSEGGGEDG